ncbi:MAG: response regulator transcription factor [Tetrasphaera sp.]|jgi:DNA-binding response OmpR family regulator|nr:response regulator transcription factor [Tetrasphaera sp.]
MARHVLVIDDEPAIRALMRAYLSAEGFRVTEAGTGADALNRVAGADRPDVVLLDIGLPDLDGLDVLRTLRRTSDVYVILVTARAEEVDRIVGLSVGADDYVTKPFSPREVVARVKSVLRRARPEGGSGGGAAESDPVLRFPGLVLDPVRRDLTLDGAPILLSSLEFDLLHALARSPGRVFSRGQLLEDVWGYDFYGDERVVDVHVRSMRKALGDDASAPRFIGTVRGVGYRFIPDPLSPAVPPGSPASHPR